MRGKGQTNFKEPTGDVTAGGTTQSSKNPTCYDKADGKAVNIYKSWQYGMTYTRSVIELVLIPCRDAKPVVDKSPSSCHKSFATDVQAEGFHKKLERIPC
jgi:hypothetical protein